MAGPAVFLLVFFAVAVTVAALAVALRARTQRNRWSGWQQMAADRGLLTDDGDPMGVGPALSGSNSQRSVQRTLAGTVDGIPVAVVMTVGLSGGPRQLHARSDLYGVARVGSPVPVDRIRAALQDQSGVSIGAVGDLAVLQPQRGLRLTVDHPPPEEAAWLFDLTARAARAART